MTFRDAYALETAVLLSVSCSTLYLEHASCVKKVAFANLHGYINLSFESILSFSEILYVLDVQNKSVRIWNCMTLVYDIIMHFVRICNGLHMFSCGFSPFFSF